jgi:glycosyltransferase involved in cell wall biosynthesis
LDGGGGLLVPGREEAFADAVIELLADNPRLQAAGERAVQAAQCYTISAATGRLLGVYKAAIESGSRGRRKKA